MRRIRPVYPTNGTVQLQACRAMLATHLLHENEPMTDLVHFLSYEAMAESDHSLMTADDMAIWRRVLPNNNAAIAGRVLTIESEQRAYCYTRDAVEAASVGIGSVADDVTTAIKTAVSVGVTLNTGTIY